MISDNLSNKKMVMKNIFYAFLAQGISLVLSVMMSLIVPRILSIEEFSYWQLFIFYSGYCGFFYFGLNDGIYLREGGTEYKNLNTKLIGSQFRLSFLFACIIAGIIAALSFSLKDESRRIVWIATAIYLPLFNANWFMGYVFQAVNKTKIYSLSVIIDRMFFIVVVFVLIFVKYDNFVLFVFLYIIGKVFALGYCIWVGREIVFAKAETLANTVKEMVINISVGINLMFSNIAGALILGSGRLVIDKIWGIATFGKISFSLLLTNFFLTFIGQISMVLFPALRQVDEARLKKFYYSSRDLLSGVLAGFLLAYMPLNYMLGLWLPQYKESLKFLALLLPLCTYDGKMNLLCNTYFKVLRKERLLLKVNLISLVLSSVLSLVGGFVFNSIYVVVISMVVSVAFRSIISEVYLAKMMGATVVNNLVMESLLVAIFVICTWYISPIIGFIAYLITYISFIIISKNKIIRILNLRKIYEQIQNKVT